MLTRVRLRHMIAEDSSTWDDPTHHAFTVPLGKRWYLVGGKVKRSDADALSINVMNASAVSLYIIDSQGAAATTTGYPGDVAGTISGGAYPLPMDPGDYVYFGFGGAQGATAIVTASVYEVSI